MTLAVFLAAPVCKQTEEVESLLKTWQHLLPKSLVQSLSEAGTLDLSYPGAPQSETVGRATASCPQLAAETVSLNVVSTKVFAIAEGTLFLVVSPLTQTGNKAVSLGVTWQHLTAVVSAMQSSGACAFVVLTLAPQLATGYGVPTNSGQEAAAPPVRATTVASALALE